MQLVRFLSLLKPFKVGMISWILSLSLESLCTCSKQSVAESILSFVHQLCRFFIHLRVVWQLFSACACAYAKIVHFVLPYQHAYSTTIIL